MPAQAVDRALGPRKITPALLNAAEAATYLSMSEEWVRLAARKGVLGSVKNGTSLRFRMRDLDAYVEALPSAATAVAS
jgi:excisionase family DNA binding protein